MRADGRENVISIDAVFRTRIRDPVLFDPWIRDPGWVKNSEISDGLEPIFFVKNYLNSFKRIRDSGWKIPY